MLTFYLHFTIFDRKLSGANVQIAKDETVQNGERKISIRGRPKDIDCALQLINEAIAESKFTLNGWVIFVIIPCYNSML